MFRVLFFALIIAFPQVSLAADAWATIGKSSDGSFALGFAGRGSGHFGAGFGLLMDGDYAKVDVLDYPVPHSDYTSLGQQKIGNTIGFDLLYFPGELKATATPYIGLGLYFTGDVDLAQSNATGWYYNQGDATQMLLAAQLGLNVQLGPKGLLGASYHNLRGFGLNIGTRF